MSGKASDRGTKNDRTSPQNVQISIYVKADNSPISDGMLPAKSLLTAVVSWRRTIQPNVSGEESDSGTKDDRTTPETRTNKNICHTRQQPDFRRDGSAKTKLKLNMCSISITWPIIAIHVRLAFDKGEGGRKKKHYLGSEFHRRSTK